MRNVIRFELELGAFLPSVAKVGDAGLDLATYSHEWVRPGERKRLYTGVKGVSLPVWAWGFIHTRSSTRERWGMEVRSSVIDTLYRGPLYIGVHNISPETVKIPGGTRLAQLVLMVNYAMDVEVEQGVVDKQTSRGQHGFGSSGH